MPVAIRNQKKTHVVFSTNEKGAAVEWAPAGDPSGDDIQQVSDDFVQNTQFLKAVGLGILAIEDDDESLRASIAKQAARYARSESKSMDEVDSVLDTTSANGVITITEDALDRHIDRLSKAQPSELSTIGENEES